MATARIGVMDAFDASAESWDSHFERFEQYVAINKIETGDLIVCI